MKSLFLALLLGEVAKFVLAEGGSGVDKLYREYVNEGEGQLVCLSESGIPYIVPLLVEIHKRYLMYEVPVLLYDDYYSKDKRFLVILNVLIASLPFPIKQGVINTSMAVPKVTPASLLDPVGNEQLAYIVFSKDLEIGARAIVEKISISTKTIFVSQSTLYQVKDFLLGHSSFYFVNVIVAVDPTLKVDLYTQKKSNARKECDINMYTHKLMMDTLGSNSIQLLTAWREDHFTRSVNLFPDKYRSGFNGLHLVASGSEVPPFIFRKKGQDSGEGYTITTWDGLEVRLLILIGEMMNFTIEFREPKEKEINDVAGIVLEELKEGKVDIGIGRIYMTSDRNSNFSFAYPHSQDCASFISLASTALPKYRAIMGPFLWDVWLALTFTYLFAIFPIALSVWHSLKPLLDDFGELENMFWYVFGTFTNCFTFTGENSWTGTKFIAPRMFIGSYWIFTIIVTACYTGSIIAFITLPVYPDVMDTAKQLLGEKYKVSTQESGGWDKLFTESLDPIALKLNKSVDFVENVIEGLRNVTRNVHSDRQSTFLGSKDNLEYIVRTNYTPEGTTSKRLLFHIGKECFVPLLVSLALPKRTTYIEKLNLAIARATQSGFINKIKREVKWAVYRSSTGKLLQESTIGLRYEDRELTLDDTQGMFLLLGAGFAIAIAVLTGEIIAWCVKEVKGRKFGQPSLKSRALDKVRQNMTFVNKCLFAPLSTLRMSFYFDSSRRPSNFFGSTISIPVTIPTSINSMILLQPPVEKPIRLRSF